MSHKLTFNELNERLQKYNIYNHEILLNENNFDKMYKSRNSKTLEFICKDCGQKFLKSLDTITISGRIDCPRCSRLRNKDKERLSYFEFLKRIKKHPRFNDYDYSLITEEWWQENYKSRQKTKIPVICKNHGVFYQVVEAHLNNHGCPTCARERQKRPIKWNKEKIIEEFNKIHKNQYEYLFDEYKNTMQIIDIKCKKCRKIFKQKIRQHLDGHGCLCNKSNGENLIEEILKENNINYSKNYYFKYKNQTLTFDFFIPKYRIAIEYDGIQHYKPVDFAGKGQKWARELFINTKKRDFLKNKYCFEENIKLIRIPFTLKEKSVIKNYLSKFLKLKRMNYGIKKRKI